MVGAILIVVVAGFCAYMILADRMRPDRSIRRRWPLATDDERLLLVRRLERQGAATGLVFTALGVYLIAIGDVRTGVIDVILFAVLAVLTLVWARRERRRLTE